MNTTTKPGALHEIDPLNQADTVREKKPLEVQEAAPPPMTEELPAEVEQPVEQRKPPGNVFTE